MASDLEDRALARDETRARRLVVRAALKALINEPFWSVVYRPALMREVAGTRMACRELVDLHEDVVTIAERNRAHVERANRASTHRLDMIGPRNAEALEYHVMERVKPHASKFAWKRARFLSYGEVGKTHEDLVCDVSLPGLRCFRWYYPFRSGTHMDNTVRSTITNRGLSFVKYQTRQCRSRMVTDENGVTTNMETHDAIVLEHATGTPTAERDAVLRIDVERLGQRQDALGRVARTVASLHGQEGFLSWMIVQDPSLRDSGSAMDAIRDSGRSAEQWLGQYLDLSPRQVATAVQELRQVAA